MTSAAIARTMVALGYGGLWILLPLWYLWLAPSTQLPRLLVAALVLPLIFPLAGLVRGRAYTYAWSGFVALLYFAHGVGEAWTWPAERVYALTEIGLSLLWFTGAIAYVRATRRR